MNYILDTAMGLLTQKSGRTKEEFKMGNFKTKLIVADLRVVVPKGESINKILDQIDKRYDTANYYLDKSIDYSKSSYDIYMVPFQTKNNYH